MTRLIPLFAVTATPAFAHQGSHDHVGTLHILTEPDHLVFIALGAAVLALAVYFVRRLP